MARSMNDINKYELIEFAKGANGKLFLYGAGECCNILMNVFNVLLFLLINMVLLLKLLPYEPIWDFNSMAAINFFDGEIISKSQSLDERKNPGK